MNENPNTGMTADNRPYAIYPQLQSVPILQREYLGGKLTLEQANFMVRRAAELGGFNTVPDREIADEDGSPVLEWFDASGVYQEHIIITPIRYNEFNQAIGGGDVFREWFNPKGEAIPVLPQGVKQRPQIAKGGQVPFDDWRAAKLEFEELYELDAGMWTIKPETAETVSKEKAKVN
jgi:hypothetical protein